MKKKKNLNFKIFPAVQSICLLLTPSISFAWSIACSLSLLEKQVLPTVLINLHCIQTPPCASVPAQPFACWSELSVWKCWTAHRQKTQTILILRGIPVLSQQMRPCGKHRCTDTSIPTKCSGKRQLPGCVAKCSVDVLLPGYKGTEDRGTEQLFGLVFVWPLSKQDCWQAHL